MAKKQKPRAPAAPLTGKQKSHLRSLAHALKPVVQIGRHGLTAGVLSALDAALEQHELVKVKVTGEAEIEPSDVAPEIAKQTRSQVAQLIGHTLVLYRRREREPKIVLPRAKAASRAPAPRAPAPVEADDAEELE